MGWGWGNSKRGLKWGGGGGVIKESFQNMGEGLQRVSPPLPPRKILIAHL